MQHLGATLIGFDTHHYHAEYVEILTLSSPITLTDEGIGILQLNRNSPIALEYTIISLVVDTFTITSQINDRFL